MTYGALKGVASGASGLLESMPYCPVVHHILEASAYNAHLHCKLPALTTTVLVNM